MVSDAAVCRFIVANRRRDKTMTGSRPTCRSSAREVRRRIIAQSARTDGRPTDRNSVRSNRSCGIEQADRAAVCRRRERLDPSSDRRAPRPDRAWARPASSPAAERSSDCPPPSGRPRPGAAFVCIIPVAIPADFALHAGNSPADDGWAYKSHTLSTDEHGAQHALIPGLLTAPCWARTLLMAGHNVTSGLPRQDG